MGKQPPGVFKKTCVKGFPRSRELVGITQGAQFTPGKILWDKGANKCLKAPRGKFSQKMYPVFNFGAQGGKSVVFCEKGNKGEFPRNNFCWDP